jgi:hypothetical protein
MPGALAPNPRPATHLWGPHKRTGVMAPVAPGWVSGILCSVGEREADRHQRPPGAVPDRAAAAAGHMGAVSAR